MLSSIDQYYWSESIDTITVLPTQHKSLRVRGTTPSNLIN